ncbi:histidine phosphatase family protein [Noviherbaspirillum saxi]|uniref:Histidine phosphatase family protein n=1 Tax=Noviherbaspirillum saxi TaxID=2320863 RepID=A0A3A3G2T4_9BURK|nr:histidine phosphatase family protein [Noviherbaspirillum saxi]RJF92373.1 hypothetical protein D3871_27510 [Noviherbaspirillum saxi]
MHKPSVVSFSLVVAVYMSCNAATASTTQTQPAIASQSSSAPQSAGTIPTGQIAEALRRGGYVIYFRHTATDFSKSDAGMQGYDDCANQRMLSEEGRADARTIGEHIRSLRLPIGDVLASPYCRTMETAQLAFKRAEPRTEIRESEGGDYAGLKRLISMPVVAGTNRWIVGHGTPFRSIAGPPHLAEGEAAVIKPGETTWTVVARIPHEKWATLERRR